jgi:DNA gyrase subunit A
MFKEMEEEKDIKKEENNNLDVDLTFKPGTTVARSIVDEMKANYLDYSMSVIVSRALPEVKDGLKPSQRRILVAMNDLNLLPNAHYRKSAKIAGDTSGNYHPHGESVVYPTLVKMAQDFSTRYPLVDGQGNFGSIDGDSPAAMRYTEARMAKITPALLDDLSKGTVTYVSNYDGTRLEPTVLPALFPNVLANGSDGIAVGMATKITSS